MDISPYLSSLSREYRIEKLPIPDEIRREFPAAQSYRIKRRGLFHAPIFLTFFDLFYLPEHEHRMREAISRLPLHLPHAWQTKRVLVLCSYNGMVDLSGDDLRSFTTDALINYLLLWRENGRWLGSETFAGDYRDDPGRVLRLLRETEAQMQA